MSKFQEKKDLLVKESEGLQAQFKEAFDARQKAETRCQEIKAQFDDRQSRINELNIWIDEEKAETEENVEACPA